MIEIEYKGQQGYFITKAQKEEITRFLKKNAGQYNDNSGKEPL